MEQRLPRLGDIVDDYCPRERRITNHAIVAIVEDAIRQTRCTTCDAEHVFKDGREPRKRKKEPESLYEQVLADVATPGLIAPRVEKPPSAPAAVEAASPPPGPTGSQGNGAAPVSEESEEAASVVEETWQSHRQLIRASLPKTDEPPPPRPIPEFTMHQRPQGRGGRNFRPGQGREIDGNVPGFGRDSRPGRSFQGGGHGFGQGNGAGGGNGSGAGSDGSRGGRGRSGRRRGQQKRAR
jgi:hypothetical protein